MPAEERSQAPGLSSKDQSLRLFLSYGHDANEELVRRIKTDLEKRGHDVWFDKSEIKFGDDWRRSITEGITGRLPALPRRRCRRYFGVRIERERLDWPQKSAESAKNGR